MYSIVYVEFESRGGSVRRGEAVGQSVGFHSGRGQSPGQSGGFAAAGRPGPRAVVTTYAVLLRRLEHDPFLDDFTHIILDDVVREREGRDTPLEMW